MSRALPVAEVHHAETLDSAAYMSSLPTGICSVVVAGLEDDEILAVDQVHEPMFFSNAA
jgi:hypothetical protein